jgi:hypothetical protein
MNLKERIIRRKEGTILFRDFFNEYNDEYVGNVCSELVKEGTLVRLLQGIYYKPVKTRLGILFPKVEEVIGVIAKRDNAVILPTGNTALHHLGLTTQVPTNYEFLTNGAARKLQVGNHTITLKHGVANNFAFKGKLMPVLHQALRAIGKDNITQEMLGQIAMLLKKSPEPTTFRHDLAIMSKWEQDFINQLNTQHNESMD